MCVLGNSTAKRQAILSFLVYSTANSRSDSKNRRNMGVLYMWEETGKTSFSMDLLLQHSLMTYLVFKLEVDVVVLVLMVILCSMSMRAPPFAIRSTIEEVIALQIFAFIYKIFVFLNHL